MSSEHRHPAPEPTDPPLAIEEHGLFVPPDHPFANGTVVERVTFPEPVSVPPDSPDGN